MKVMHIIGGGDRGGAKTHVLSLLKALGEDIEIKLVCLREGSFADEALSLGLDVLVIKKPNPFSFWRDIYKLFMQGGFDIAHCHGAKANLVGALLRRKGVRVVTTVHSDYRLDYMGSPLKQMTFGLINSLSLRFLSAYTAVSDSMRDMLVERGFNPEKISVIYNGMDFFAPSAPLPREEFLSSLGLDWNDKILCGVAARLEKVKDFETLIKGFAKASKKSGGLRLLIAGEGEEKERLRALAASLGVEKYIFFAGWVADIDSFMNALDISLLTSISETFPYTVLEGVKFRCASVVTSVGGMPALVDDGVNGFLIKPGDHDALADRLVRLSEDELLRKTFAGRLFEKASREFSMSAMRDAQEAIYKKLLAKNPDGLPKRRVMVCGAYGRGNSGDDAILEAIVKTLREIDQNLGICVLSRKPGATRLRYNVSSAYIFNFPKLALNLKKTGLFISGGGTLIQDTTSTRSLLFYLYAIWLAKRSGAKVMLYGCGIGPVSKSGNIKLTRDIINRCADVITLRERLSLEVLEAFGINKPRIVLTADPALNLTGVSPERERALIEAEGLKEGESYICFALREWKNYSRQASSIAECAKYAYERHGLTPVFIPMENPTDFPAINLVLRGLSSPYAVIRGGYSPSEIISFLGRMKIVVGMRLHSLIFAASRGVEVIGLAYDQKVTGFMEYMNLDLNIELKDLTAGALKGLIDIAAQREQDFSGGRVANAKKLRELEGQNGRLAKALLEYEQ